jgi:hypothetical protein
MIYESQYWKKELKRINLKIQKRLDTNNFWTETQYGTFEKEIMIGFYIIRKLVEAKKLTTKIISTPIEGLKYANNGKNITLMNFHRYDEFFKLDKPIKHNFDLAFICNQIIHSYIFSPNFSAPNKSILDKLNQKIELNEDDYDDLSESNFLISIYFSSDFDRNKYLYEIEIKKIIQLFTDIANCDVGYIYQVFNPKTKDYDRFSSDEEIDIPQEIKALIKKADK